MSQYLGLYLRDAAERVVGLCQLYNIPPTLFSFQYNAELSSGIEQILQDLLEEVEFACLSLATDTDKADESVLLPFINREVDGLDFDERMENYVDTFRSELEDYVTLRLSQDEVSDWDVNWKGFSHKGMSAFNLLDRLTRFTIASAWMYAYISEMESRGCIGFYSMRGSSYPCDLCDEMKGFHKLDDAYPPYHANCKCIMIPIYI